MTTIIVKNADFSAGRISHYSPPVQGATLCAFVGDADDNTCLRNFGSGADLVVSVGAPASQGAAFRQFSYQNYLTAGGAYFTPNTTLLMLHRTVGAITNWGIGIASERTHADGGRRGVNLNRYNSGQRISAAVMGTSGGAQAQVTANTGATDDASPTPAFVAATFQPAGSGSRVDIYRVSAPAKSASSSNTTNATLVPTADESSYPFRVGHSYLSSAYGLLDIGFVAAFPRLLSYAEITKMYASVQKRFASLGVTV
jgi:hypothetical protein